MCSSKNYELIDEICGKKVVVKEDILPGLINGKVEYNGTLWKAQSRETIIKGSIAEIKEQSNLTLIVEPVVNYINEKGV